MALLAVLASFGARAVDPDDLLPVDAAFPLTAVATGPDRIEVRWGIADGYYLYRHRMSAAPTTDAFSADGDLALPAGKRYTDEFFGEVETYRGGVTGVLEGARRAGADTVTLDVRFQGCADIGVCYPPQRRTVRVALADAATGGMDPAPAAGGLLALPGTGGTGGLLGGSDEPLPPEQAFRVEAIAGDGNTLLVRMTPARGYYLYRDKTRFDLDAGDGLAAAAPQRWPAGTAHEDEYFGRTTVYFDQVEVALPVTRTHPRPARGTLTVGFQGCQADGICYPPMSRALAVDLPAGTVATAAATPGDDFTPAAAATGGAGSDPARPDPATPTTPAATPGTGDAATGADPAPDAVDDALAEDARLARGLEGPGRWVALAGFLGAGLLLAFTPCVLPMVPILSGLIAGASSAHGGRLGARRALALSAIYVFASALVFTAAGVVAGLVGANLQVAFQAPWVIVAFSLLFVALALAMFGAYELQLPAGLRSRLGAMADRQRGGSWAGVAAMGALSALIVGPCVAPPLAAAVLYIGQTRDPVFGGMALFALAIGMGLPLLAFGAAAGRGLPTSGPWMVAVQRVFGFVFLGLAVWMLSRLLPGPWTLALYGLLALGAAAWTLGLATPAMAARRQLALRLAGMLLAVAGAAQLFGAFAGGDDPLRPLARLGGPVEKLEFRMIKSPEDLAREVAAARAAGRPLLFDYYADWCVSCKEMDKYTFSEPAVQSALAGYVLLKADVTANDAIDQALMREHGIIGPPATLFFVDGREQRALRLIGFEPAEDFLDRIGRVPGPATAAGAD
ncbi:protein-disulfide reductase DsbD [Luteimonas pelagia]